ncbi:phage tail tape measure protein [Paenibacillus filicis]|uniref:Phage tail tape measure protein n=1 Tax=Paenibacillus filicis TaxID=669464 RepID=A0ABU9DVJ4_9BACL
MSLLGNLIVNIIGNSSGLDDAIDKAEKAVDQFGKNLSDVGKSMSLLVTAPIAGLGALAVKSSIEFESAFAGVIKTVDATEAQLSGLRSGILSMSDAIPASAKEIAGVAEAAGQLGIKTENIMGFTRTMVDLGVATNLSSNEAATALARLANITQMPQDQFDRLGSTIVGLGNNLATTESEILEMGLRIAGAGHQIGLSEAQILGFAGALSSVGIQAEAGGSSISRVMIDIAQAVATGGKAVGGFAAVAGMSAEQFQKAFKQDAGSAVISFIEGLGKMSAAGENVFGVLDDLGLSEILVRDALLRASGAGDLFRESLEIGTKAWEENNALTKEAETRYATTESQLKILRNRFDGMARTIGDALVPVLLSALKAAEPFFQMLVNATNWFSKLDQSIKGTIIVIAAIVAAIGPVLVVVGTLISSFSTLMPVLAAITGPVGLIVAGVAALAAGLVYLYNTNETVRSGITAAWEALKNVSAAVFNAIKSAVTMAFDGIKAFWSKWGGEITSFFQNVWNLIKSIFVSVIDTVRSLVVSYFNAIKSFWDKWGDDITAAFNTYLGILKTVWSFVFEQIWTFVKFIFGEIQTFWDKWGSTILEAFRNVFSILQAVFSRAIDVVFVVIKLIFGQIKAFWDIWGKTILGVFETVFNVLKTVFNGAWEAIKIVVETAIGVISNIIKFWLSALKGDWKGAWDALKGIVSSVWDGITGIFSTIFDTMVGIGKDIILGLIKGISNASGAVWDTMKGVATNISEGFKKFFDIHSPSRLMAGYGENISEGVAEGISYASWKAEQESEKMAKKTAKAGSKAATAAAKAAREAAKKIADEISEAFESAKFDFKMGNLDADGYVAALEKIKENYKLNAEQIRKIDLEVNKTQMDLAKNVEKAAKEATKAAKKSYDDYVRDVDQLGSAITTALKKRYDIEERAVTESLQKQIDEHKKASAAVIEGYDKEYKAKLKTLDVETQLQLKAIQDQIDGINGLTKAEDKAADEAAYQKKLADKQKELSDATTADAREKIQAELNEMIAERQRKHLLEQRQLQIDALRMEMDRIKEQAAQKQEALNKEYEAKKKNEEEKAKAVEKGLIDQMAATKKHYGELTTEEALQAEARRLALDENNTELVELLGTYNPQWQNAGQSFGRSLLDGLNSTKKSIQDAVTDILSLVSKGNSAALSGGFGAIDIGNEAEYLKNLIESGTQGQREWALDRAKQYGFEYVSANFYLDGQKIASSIAGPLGSMASGNGRLGGAT